MNYRAIKFDENPLLRPGLPIGRSRLLQWVLLFVLLLLITRSFYLQFFQDEFLQRKGESLYKRTIDTPPIRGTITDRRGKILAQMTPVKSVWINPVEIRKNQQEETQADKKITTEQFQTLAQKLNLSMSDLQKRLNEKGEFVYLKRQISPEVVDQIGALNLPGVYTQTEFRRYYPGGNVMAHIVGFVGIDGEGQEGLELTFQNTLAGSAGQREVLRDRKGQIVEEIRERSPAQHGQNLALSIDSPIQYFAYQRIKEAVEEHQAKSGSVLVIDAETGEILAMANYPSFNPNNRETFKSDRVRNRAVTDMFEPGSVMKPFTVGLALDKKVVKPDTVIDLKPGYLQFGRRRIRDVHRYDELTVTGVIVKSSNIGTAKIAALMDNQSIWQMLRTLNFGHITRSELPGEAPGMLAKPDKWQPVDQAVISYGHGISTTLIQLAGAYTVFARDDGTMVTPTILANQTPKKSQKIFTPETVKSIRNMLEVSMVPGGTGAFGAVSGYRVGGKTGTALKIVNGQYVKKYQSSFIGIGPMSKPKLVVAVTLDEPTAGSYYAGRIVAPIFADIMGNALRQVGILPDAPQTMSQPIIDPATVMEEVI